MSRPPLIIPVENQTRELDAKLLLALVAAERGFPVVLGSRTHVHFEIASLPLGIYLAKSMRTLSERMFTIMRRLGMDIVAWDEEALIHAPPERFYKRGISTKAMELTSAVFAWGPDNVDLFRECPGYSGVPIHATGNPRFDLMRAEVAPYFEPEAQAIRERYGNFILVNTNFGTVNQYNRNVGFRPGAKNGPERASDAYPAELAQHRLALFHSFLEMIPRLADAFPSLTIIVRPHPVEGHGRWREAAEGRSNVQVVHEGNVIPWLLSAKSVIQNGCTTGVEAFILRTPCVAYQPATSERYDNDLPMAMCHRAFDRDELVDITRTIVDGGLGPCDESTQWKLLERFVAALEGPLASERIVDVLEEKLAAAPELPSSSFLDRAKGRLESRQRKIEKQLMGMVPGHRNSSDYFSHRFPELSVEDLQERIVRFDSLLGRFEGIQARRISKHVFEINKPSNRTP
jgi:surface carbohydrate biosynthesis protein